MKRILLTGLLALALAGTTVQKASAWSKFCFSVGMNVSWETGGSCTKFLAYERTSYPPPCAYGYAPPVYAAPLPPAALPAVPAPVHPAAYHAYPGYAVTPAYWWGN